jgi:hypothetical protein
MRKILFAVLFWGAVGNTLLFAQDPSRNDREKIQKIEEKKVVMRSAQDKMNAQTKEALTEAEDEVSDAIQELEEILDKTSGSLREQLLAVIGDLRRIQGEIRSIRKGTNEARIEPASGDTLRIRKQRKIILRQESSDSSQVIEDSTIIELGDQDVLIGRNKKGKLKFNIIKDEEKDKNKKPENLQMNLFGLDLGFNALLDKGSFSMSDANRDFELRQGPSLHVTFRLLKTRFNLYKNHLHLLTALEFDIQNYKFRQPITIEPRTPRFDYRYDSSTVYNVNKLSASYFQVPLMLHYTAKNRNLKRSFRVSGGGYAGILLDSWTRQDRKEGGKVVQDDRFHLNPIRYGLSFRVGYGPVELYANYNLNPLFEKNKGAPNLTPLCIGINLADF